MISSKVDAENDIFAKAQELTGVDVMQGTYTSDFFVPKKDAQGFFVPYITLAYGTAYRTTDRHITTTRDDPQRVTVTCYVVGPTDKIARQIRSQLEDKLIGFVPQDSGELAIQGGYNFEDADLGLHRYIYAVIFAYTTNLTAN